MIIFEPEKMTDAQIADAREKWSNFIKNNNIDLSNPNQTYMIPNDLPILVPSYQIDRFEKTKKVIKHIVAEFDEYKVNPIKINIRTDGKFAGIGFVTDGLHTLQSRETLNHSTYWSQIISVSKNRECTIFAAQKDNTTNMSIIHLLNAALDSNDMTDKNVQRAHNFNNVLMSFGINYTNHAITSIKTLYDISKKLTRTGDTWKTTYDGTSSLIWALTILTKSNYITLPDGLRADILTCLDGTYTEICMGMHGDITPNDTIDTFIKHMRTATWGSILKEHEVTHNVSSTHSSASDRRKRVKEVFSDWIHADFATSANAA